MPATALPAAVTEGKSARTVRTALRLRNDADGDADRCTERALRSDEDAAQVVARDVHDVAAQGHEVAVGRAPRRRRARGGS